MCLITVDIIIEWINKNERCMLGVLQCSYSFMTPRVCVCVCVCVCCLCVNDCVRLNVWVCSSFIGEMKFLCKRQSGQCLACWLGSLWVLVMSVMTEVVPSVAAMFVKTDSALLHTLTHTCCHATPPNYTKHYHTLLRPHPTTPHTTTHSWRLHGGMHAGGRAEKLCRSFQAWQRWSSDQISQMYSYGF